MSEFVIHLLWLVTQSAILYFLLYAFFTVFELLIPAERNQSFKGRKRNVLITLLYLVFGLAALLLLHKYIPMSAGLISTTWLPELGVIFLFLFVGDFFYYWYHRAQHTVPWLWPIHEIHHAETELNVTSSYRTYWMEIPIQAFVVSFPASFIIGDLGSLYLISVITFTFWEFFTHANLRLHLGWFSPVICGPQVHRIHHSAEARHRNTNFAQLFPVLDVMFGTYYAPAKDEFPKTGGTQLSVDAPLKETVFLHPIQAWVDMLRNR